MQNCVVLLIAIAHPLVRNAIGQHMDILHLVEVVDCTDLHLKLQIHRNYNHR